MAKEIPQIPTGKDCKLLAKLKAVKEPLGKVEAIIVITTKLIWEMAKLMVLGTIILPIFLSFSFFPFKTKEYLNPKL